jgi:hypothetical protein
MAVIARYEAICLIDENDFESYLFSLLNLKSLPKMKRLLRYARNDKLLESNFRNKKL